jgi:hypothetical protein
MGNNSFHTYRFRCIIDLYPIVNYVNSFYKEILLKNQLHFSQESNFKIEKAAKI